MAETKKIIPKRRFREFQNAEAWELFQLGELATELVAGGDINKDLIKVNGKYPVIANALTKDGIVGFYDKEYRIKAPAVTITGRGDVGHAKARKVDFTPVVRLVTLKSNHDVDFMENAINRLNIIVESTGVPQLTVPQLGKYELYFPKSSKEEKSIGKLFVELDNLITLNQRKLDKIKSTKKAYLYEMFPAEGESKPKRRFKGFTDDWEQCELSRICSMNARIGWQNLRTSEFLDSGDYYLITGTDFKDGRVDFNTCHYVEKYRYDQDQKIQIANGSILITKDGTLGKIAYVEGLDKPATLNAGVFNITTTAKNIDKQYLFQYLKAPFLMNYVDKKATGGTIKHLNKNILVDFPVILPKIDEQRLIGDHFTKIDNLITLHQHKLDKLKNLKKSYLNEMFI